MLAPPPPRRSARKALNQSTRPVSLRCKRDGIATCPCPNLLIHRSQRIKIRHQTIELLPDSKHGARRCVRQNRFDSTSVECDRKIILQVTCLENWVLAPRHSEFHHLGDVVEYLEDPNHTVPACLSLSAQRLKEFGRKHAVSSVTEYEGYFVCSA